MRGRLIIFLGSSSVGKSYFSRLITRYLPQDSIYLSYSSLIREQYNAAILHEFPNLIALSKQLPSIFSRYIYFYGSESDPVLSLCARQKDGLHEDLMLAKQWFRQHFHIIHKAACASVNNRVAAALRGKQTVILDGPKPRGGPHPQFAIFQPIYVLFICSVPTLLDRINQRNRKAVSDQTQLVNYRDQQLVIQQLNDIFTPTDPSSAQFIINRSHFPSQKLAQLIMSIDQQRLNLISRHIIPDGIINTDSNDRQLINQWHNFSTAMICPTLTLIRPSVFQSLHAHAIEVTGPSGVGKTTFCRQFLPSARIVDFDDIWHQLLLKKLTTMSRSGQQLVALFGRSIALILFLSRDDINTYMPNLLQSYLSCQKQLQHVKQEILAQCNELLASCEHTALKLAYHYARMGYTTFFIRTRPLKEKINQQQVIFKTLFLCGSIAKVIQQTRTRNQRCLETGQYYNIRPLLAVIRQYLSLYDIPAGEQKELAQQLAEAPNVLSMGLIKNLPTPNNGLQRVTHSLDTDPVQTLSQCF